MRNVPRNDPWRGGEPRSLQRNPSDADADDVPEGVYDQEPYMDMCPGMDVGPQEVILRRYLIKIPQRCGIIHVVGHVSCQEGDGQ